MKKFIIAALAAVVATVSLAGIAEAGWRDHSQNDWDRYDAYRYSEIGYRPDDCFIKVIKDFNHQGNLVVRQMRFCR